MNSFIQQDSFLPQQTCQIEHTIDTNPYPNIYIDLTLRCNMKCNYCYNPLRDKSDLDPGYFETACQRFPQPVNFRFLGGEPTMHPRFFDFIRIARQYGHTVFFASNGFNYTRPAFMKKLCSIEQHFVPGLSMDGGTRHNRFYQIMNNQPCLETKLAALNNLHRFHIKRVCLSAIIIRAVNESVIEELLEAADRYRNIVRYIHFRSAAMVGRWADTLPYTQAELIELMRPHFSKDELKPKCVAEIHCNEEQGGDCCYRFRPTPRLQISLIEFASEKSTRCPKRGKLLADNFRIQPFFENMINTGEILADKFGEVVINNE